MKNGVFIVAFATLASGGATMAGSGVVDGGGRVIHRGDAASYEICNVDEGTVSVEIQTWNGGHADEPDGTRQIEYGQCRVVEGTKIRIVASPRSRKVEATWTER